jgi:hypothetical protein
LIANGQLIKPARSPQKLEAMVLDSSFSLKPSLPVIPFGPGSSPRVAPMTCATCMHNSTRALSQFQTRRLIVCARQLVARVLLLQLA